MTRPFRKLTLSFAAALAIATTGCGSHSGSPLGPSSSPKTPQSDLRAPGQAVVGAAGLSTVRSSSEVEFKGKVESISSPDLKVGGVTVHTDSGTEIKRGRTRIAVTDLLVGETVEVTGTLQPDGTIRATQVEVSDDAVDFKGKVESISPPDLKVNGMTVHTDADTRITRAGLTISLTDVQVGETVKVEGFLLGDGSVRARRIEVGQNDEDDEVEFKGAVQSISPPNLTVGGVKVSTDGSTEIERDDHRIALTDLKVGEIVKVEGRLLPDGTVMASHIEAGEDEDEVELEGTIQAINPPSLTVNGITVVTDASTTITKDCDRVTLTQLKVGDRVKIEGILQPDGTVLARRIKAGKCDKDDDEDDDDDDHEGDDD